LRLHYAPHPIKSRLFLAYDNFIRLPDNQIKWSGDRIVPSPLPEFLELHRFLVQHRDESSGWIERSPSSTILEKNCREYLVVTWEEAQDYARHFEKVLPPHWAPAAMKTKRSSATEVNKDTNTRVQEVLGRDLDATSGDISRETGIPEQTVRNMTRLSDFDKSR
jgi:hypothetical protein